MTFSNSPYLVESHWLEEHLADSDLRILDCTVYFHLYDGGVRRESGRDSWAAGHIPGSDFADLLGALADRNSRFPFMMPSAQQFEETMSLYGVGEGTRVILYDAVNNKCAARLWWMLQAFGFDNAAVLNGGWCKWSLEKRSISINPAAYPTARFRARPRPGLIVDKKDVLTATGDSGICLLSALPENVHLGTAVQYERPGRIPSSVNVPAEDIVDPKTDAYLSSEQLREKFEAVGAINRDRVIVYCGGGVAACSDAFVLTLLGVENVSVYDGALSEWAADPTLPMEMG